MAPRPAQTRAREPLRARTRRERGAASYLVIFALLVGYATVSVRWPLPPWVAAIYVVASVACFCAYAADKRAAQAGRWRVSENTLLFLSAIGGWPGAIVAQQTLRHKTKKASFRFEFWVTVVVNVVAFIVFCTPVFALLTRALSHLAT
ncbi:DUF1294 domain-containing protein [Cryobacterium tepidiphilum]|uniref:DUF1294 domain-containing protein n=1 Tax=Cryobacterium tepidiphilum TaxID=2486026 RepID=A0A3M8LHU9_9MICO|nr:DUF1294 domain-containing protein [Cryobacterium tepidiphilum]RNE64214.1 DUF1294 domain-containing protein [Cryobacterium tepidiphilum]